MLVKKILFNFLIKLVVSTLIKMGYNAVILLTYQISKSNRCTFYEKDIAGLRSKTLLW